MRDSYQYLCDAFFATDALYIEPPDVPIDRW
jgi:hypothetical protein